MGGPQNTPTCAEMEDWHDWRIRRDAHAMGYEKGWREGAERMREACAQHFQKAELSGRHIAEEIRSIPLPGDD